MAVGALDSFAEEFYHCGRLITPVEDALPVPYPFHSITPVQMHR
jgi:hypothetical protein